VVEAVIARLLPFLPTGVTADTSFEHKDSHLSIPSPCTLREALTNYVDLSAPPLKRQLRILAHYCKGDEKQQRCVFSTVYHRKIYVENNEVIAGYQTS
jgi:hypothetical protein